MRPASGARWSFPIAAALLLIFFAQIYFASAVKSPTWDEPGHIASGVAWTQLGSLAVNPQHPPLLKALSGISLTLGGGRWPDVPQARELLAGTEKWQWDIGSLILIKAGVDRAIQWARLPLMLVAVLGGLIVFLWGRQIAGDLAALCALLLYVADPTIGGHAYLVTMDVGLAVFSLLFLFCLWSYLRTPRIPWLVACAIALGLALCAKFTAVVLLPLAAGLLFAGRFRPATAVKAAPNDPCPCGSGKKFRNCHMQQAASKLDVRWVKDSAISLLWMFAGALVVVMAVYRFQGIGPFVDGIAKVNADHAQNYMVYMSGRLAAGFPSYFAVAYLLKEPLAAIVLAAAGVWLLLRSSAFRLIDKLFLLVPPVAIFLLHAWKADNLGIRYIIPCLPFAHLTGGIALASLGQSVRPVLRVSALVLGAWVIVAAAGIYPDGLSYFNESACLLDDSRQLGLDGGSRCGVAWLDDSNVDWGGGLKQLKAWMARNAPNRTVRLAYFGSFPPQAYDAPFEVLTDPQLWFRPAPGLYAVSAHLVAHFGALVRLGHVRGDEWLSRTPPTAIVGHNLYIYDLR